MKLRLARCIGAAVILCCSATGAAAALSVPSAQPIPPSEIHRQEGQARSRALLWQRQWVRPAYVLDQSGFDATYYALDLTIDEVGKQVSGSASMRAGARVGSFNAPTFNFTDSLTVDSVRSFGRLVAWSHVGWFLYITLDSVYSQGEEFEVTTFYHGRPPTGGFQGFEFGSHWSVPMISTLSEPYLAQSWWPCKDTPSDKADSTDVRVRVNSTLYAVSNGTLRDSVDNGDGTTTYWWHEQYPITTYLVSLAITNYARFDRWYHYGPGGVDSMPIRFYSYPENLASAQANWPVAADQLAYYASVFGEYPFLAEKYGIAHFTWGGAMEHQTVSSHTGTNFGFNTYVIGHELSHQWWGDMVTCRDWHHIWLNEGFASYCEALWAEHTGGSSAYISYMNGMAYWTGGRIYIDDTTDVWNIFSSRVYDKAAWVLHMLRGVVGDSTFFAILRAYYADPRYQYKDAVTEDFRDLAESISGVDLHPFFDDWIYGYYYPQYVHSWFFEPDSGGWRIFIHLRQTQTTNPQAFRMPVQFAVSGTAKTTIRRWWNTAREQDFSTWLDYSPTGETIDPNNWILDQSHSEPYGVRVLNDSLRHGLEYTSFRDSLIAKGGMPGSSKVYSLVSGTLPAGFTFDTASGLIQGSLPMDSSTSNLTFGVKVIPDGWTTQRAYTLRIDWSPYMPGDQNGDRKLDVQDVVLLISYVFRGCTPPVPISAADPDADCRADVLDIVTLINYVFRNGPFPHLGCLQ